MEYLIHEKSKWVEIDMLCPRDGEKLYVEQLSNGNNTNHFACARIGCTWPSYPENIGKIQRKMKINNQSINKERIDMKTGIELIAIERQEQIDKHYRTVKSDVKWNDEFQLAEGAAKLILQIHDGSRFTKTDTDGIIPFGWNSDLWYKMNLKSYKERLIIAGALIAAEIDRIQFNNQ